MNWPVFKFDNQIDSAGRRWECAVSDWTKHWHWQLGWFQIGLCVYHVPHRLVILPSLIYYREQKAADS